MLDLIRRTVHRLSLLLGPGTGTHRARPRIAWQPYAAAPHRPAAPLSLPRHRSPYGLDAPLDGDASRLVRPYLTAHDQERARQRRRRTALVLAADFGIDLDRHLIGAEGVLA
ncbi:hypothetical protein [Streptomyces sp. NPDC002580]|jgi:hypothetical protein|uniref:hypothetical protein n=1 Tax=Streptomyces sp. NPDC002580 TaxID=3364653 RepID=UPI003695F1D6